MGMLSVAGSLPAWRSCPGCPTCSCRHALDALPELASFEVEVLLQWHVDVRRVLPAQHAFQCQVCHIFPSFCATTSCACQKYCMQQRYAARKNFRSDGLF